LAKTVKKYVYRLPEAKKNLFERLTDRLFGGLEMNWLTVLLMAVCTAVITTVFICVRLFRNTSFERMGVYLEAWFFFAIIIMSNCRKPLESAVKTFVFFLVSQPLIYLLEVILFGYEWSVFRYYRYWFMMTLLTFPMAYAGWYIKKKNWLSALIISPVLAFMGAVIHDCGAFCTRHFPRLLVTCLFCALQIAFYVMAFFPEGLWKKIAGYMIPVIVIAGMLLFVPKLDMRMQMFLPDDPVLTEQASAETEDASIAEVTVCSTGKDSMIEIHAHDFGTADFVIRDGDSEYRYTLTVYEDDGGHNQIDIRKR
jgi:hypothetical protein